MVRRRLVFQQPVRTGRGEFDARDSLLVELRDADGAHGLGEAAPWPGFGEDDLVATERALRAALTRLETMDLTSESATMPDPVAATLENHPAAHAAVEGALCDLAARRAGSPLARWLAQRAAPSARAASERVACGALLLGRTPEAVRDEAAQVRASGYRAAKLKLGGVPLDVDVARVRAARAGLGPRVRLRGDANGAWSRAEAARAFAALAVFELEYVEQPVAAEDLEGLAALRGRSSVRVAADESVAGEPGLRAVIDARAADVVVLKPALLGGPLRTLVLAAQARTAGLDVVLTHALDSAVGAWHAVNCAAAWADSAAVHGLRTAGLFVTDVGPAVEATAGFVTLSGRPGLGFESWH
ncbi:MAG TPA: o-succinylbenzoate synthase [Steroidobacteraceae bacterium]|nr:o-succinylbenzoate synthase [Steroidobacteraceae bacterium]